MRRRRSGSRSMRASAAARAADRGQSRAMRRGDPWPQARRTCPGGRRAAAVERADRRVSHRDGWIMVALVREEQFGRLMGALGRPDLADDPRFADFAARAAHAASSATSSARSSRPIRLSGWLARLRAADILADRVNGFDDWLADPQSSRPAARLPSTSPRWTVPGAANTRDLLRGRCRVAAGARMSASTGARSSPGSASTAAIARLVAEGIVLLPGP